MNFKSFYWALIILIFTNQIFLLYLLKITSSLKSSNYLTNLDKINLFDGSEIGGQMIRLRCKSKLLLGKQLQFGQNQFEL